LLGAAVDLDSAAFDSVGEVGVGGGLGGVGGLDEEGEEDQGGEHGLFRLALRRLCLREWFCGSIEESGRALPDAHLSDDETVAKMGHPVRWLD
jgi:hypothetical protein